MTNKPFFYHGQDPNWVTVRDNNNSEQQLHLTLVSEADTLISTIFVRCDPDNEEELIEMTRGETHNRLQYWHAAIPVNEDQPITHYCFKIMQNSRQWWLHGNGVSHAFPGEKHTSNTTASTSHRHGCNLKSSTKFSRTASTMAIRLSA
ncbi:maltodextrin glucosidase [Photobacterium aphoticum]|uniref:Maltodextrin glucosidase n=1 Tax=Photobacterium aphoticum TaxID=754436 RepID=A0A090RHU4_9GAMM|nr:maltodextrin glucosidase [Photobacterium aphoticum]